jgi:hypothetical protein
VSVVGLLGQFAGATLIVTLARLRIGWLSAPTSRHFSGTVCPALETLSIVGRSTGGSRPPKSYPMMKLCWAPVAASWFVPAVTEACSVQVPAASKLTVWPETEQTEPVSEATDGVPSPALV